MPTICWTVIRHAAAPFMHGIANAAHVVRHFVGPAMRPGAWSLHHAPGVVAHPRVWFELVCKVVPVAVVGGGLLAPHPANPPRPPEPQELIQPAPPAPLGVPWGWLVPPTVGLGSIFGTTGDTPELSLGTTSSAPGPGSGETDAAGVIEPSTGPLLLTALGGLLLIRFAVRSDHADRH